jgi:Uma2 family endonuclease
MPAPNPQHNTSVGLTDDLLRAAFGRKCWVRIQMPLILGLATDPVPDIAVVTGTPRDYAHAQPRSALLVVEISESTLAYDTHEKANLYAASGIADYWVVDLVHRTLIVFRDPVTDPAQLFGAAYRSRVVLDSSVSVAALSAHGTEIPVADLLP